MLRASNVGVIGLIGALTAVCAAQPTTVRDQLYTLERDSTYQQGCFDPCLCPLWQEVPVTGSFRLSYARTEGWFTVYSVSEVAWTIESFGSRIEVSGGGEYRIGGHFARQHQLALRLRVGDQETQLYDSRLIVGGSEFPRIRIPISINNFYCYDQVFNLNAVPVRPPPAGKYTIQRSSTYQEGCFPPCLCPLLVEQALTGSFSLVELPSADPLFRQFAVRDFAADTISTFPTIARRIRGSGTYRVAAGTGQHQLILDVSINGGEVVRLDSELVDTTTDFPRIDILVDQNNGFCFDRVIDLHAEPARAVTFGPTAAAAAVSTSAAATAETSPQP